MLALAAGVEQALCGSYGVRE
eukprot:gene15306-biopygen17005